MMMIRTLLTCSPPTSLSWGCRPPPSKSSSVPHVFSVVMQSDASSKPDGAAGIHSRGGGLFRYCGRWHFIQSLTTSALFPVHHSKASDSSSQASVPLVLFSEAMLNKVHPQRPQWYEELQVFFLDEATKSYENEISGYKAQLSSHLEGKAKEVLEIGIGIGPNIEYYAGNDVNVIGLDPLTQLLEHLYCALSPTLIRQFPVKMVLKPDGQYVFVEYVVANDGTIARFLQQAVVDGCHLTRETEKNITGARFSRVDLNTASLTDAFPISPHNYGIASK